MNITRSLVFRLYVLHAGRIGVGTQKAQTTQYIISIKICIDMGSLMTGIVHIIQVSMLASAPREINHSTRSSYPGDARVPHKEVRDARFREEEKKILYD